MARALQGEFPNGVGITSADNLYPGFQRLLEAFQMDFEVFRSYRFVSGNHNPAFVELVQAPAIKHELLVQITDEGRIVEHIVLYH